jgi:hypothetical protein
LVLNTRQDLIDRGEKGDAAGARLAAWAAAIGLLVVGASLFMTAHDRATLFPRDLPVYQAAIDAFAAGADPYRPALAHHAHGLFFTSPPFVWLLYKFAAHSALKPVFGPVLLAADAISVVALPMIFSRLLLGPGLTRMALGVGFFFTAFAGAGFFTAMVINNGTPLYALIAAGLIPGVTRRRWLGFHLAVTLATAFKPFYAAFWIVPVLADGLDSGEWTASVAGLGVAAMTYVVPALIAPKLTATWLHALARQTLGEGLLGDNLLGAVFHEPFARHASWAPYAAQGALSVVLVGASLVLGRLDRGRRIAGLLLAAVFLNPRVMRYDLCIAAIPLLAVAAGALARNPGRLTAQAFWAVALAGVMIIRNQSDAGADGFLYPGLAVLALVVAIVASWRPGAGRAPGQPP